eukprot:Plantae.Rhodophyta-Purpureofilum_apyrenoidigerum.ctg22422.p1 GENE.Plantae.Rhodophyta-Purpureofilum_apyrenoidigerum.ctg22422~~Plantae.Rhodophyta-Purpureofilum_apyrenoidigerum.ctg22422.p1  ORF type:complete len:231 (+),score=50.89 Plantae.Rhodophyta-Purpureofilum_apyrenoidigerum.ctg22422:82-693(+)
MAFVTGAATGLGRCRQQWAVSVRMSAASKEARIPRRDALRLLGLITAGVAAAPALAGKDNKFETGLRGVCECERVMQPVRKYIEAGQWDKARTNINYCTRNLRLKTVMKQTSDFFEDPLEGIEIMAEMENTFTQLDASVYTPIFIPADDGVITPEQKKYQTQAFMYLDEALDYLSNFLKLAPEDKVKKAREEAAKSRFEIKVE